MLHRNICDVNRPCLVWFVNNGIAGQVLEKLEAMSDEEFAEAALEAAE